MTTIELPVRMSIDTVVIYISYICLLIHVSTDEIFCNDGERPVPNINCGRGGQKCPSDHFCDIHPTDRYAVCCKEGNNFIFTPAKEVIFLPGFV